MPLKLKVINGWKTAISRLFSRPIKYKIVEEKNGTYIVQCSYLRATMHLSLSNIVSDPILILGFSPEQACFLGIKTAQHLGNVPSINVASIAKITQNNNCRYKILYELRGGKICFANTFNLEEHVMCPVNISINNKLLNNFGPGYSFYIGYLAGLISLSTKKPHFLKASPVSLYIVKN